MQCRFIVVIAVAILGAFPAQGAEENWVTSDRLNRRTCPEAKCGVVGQLFYREAVTVHERRGSWARITEPYDASCRNGKSEYVDEGNGDCSVPNGIENGKFAEWVASEFLSAARPPDPAAKVSGTAKVLAGSDDFRQHQAAFVKAADDLIGSGQCTLQDFEEVGGWLKSTNHRNEPVYFAYCGGMRASNRIYLNAVTGRTFR